MNKLLALLALLVLARPLAAQSPAPALIPFQGRLTDQNGVAYSSNQYTVVFQLYDQAVGGTLLWAERHEKVGLVNGMVNVFLGSINANLGTNNFSTTRYLGITVDGDNNPNTPDPEMFPRQLILPVIWAKKSDDSLKLSGHDWTPIFGANNPTLPIPGAKIADSSVLAAKLAPGVALLNLSEGSIESSKLAPGSALGNLLDQSIPGSKLSDGTVTSRKLVQPSLAMGASVVESATSSTSAFTETGLTVTINATGRPIEVSLVPSNPNQLSSVYNGEGQGVVAFFRNGSLFAQFQIGIGVSGGPSTGTFYPSSAFRVIDTTPTTSSTTYDVRLKVTYQSPGYTGVVRVSNTAILALEK